MIVFVYFVGWYIVTAIMFMKWNSIFVNDPMMLRCSSLTQFCVAALTGLTWPVIVVVAVYRQASRHREKGPWE